MSIVNSIRCGAKARSAGGRPCLHVALENGRCHYHGGKAAVKHGKYTKMAMAQRSNQRKIINEMRAAVKSLESLVDKST